MKMLDTLSRNPSIAVSSGIGVFVTNLMHTFTPPLQFIVLVGSAVLVVLTIVLKIRELKNRV